jgi:quinol monooxygenase YgiN
MPHSSKLIELVQPALAANSPCRGQVKRTMPKPEQIRKCSEGGHMFARIVQITAKPGQGPNLSQHTRDRTINVLKQQPGFIDMLVVKSDTDPNQFVGISLWKSKEEAEKFLASQQWQQLLQEFRPLVQGEPIIRTFNVDASTMHNVGITRAA